MKREILNECRLSFPSLSVNESYARAAAAALDVYKRQQFAHAGGACYRP